MYNKSVKEKKEKETNEKRVEILAPAGSFAALSAAVKAGANSVYFGVADFNMRATAAKNFEVSDLPEIVKNCSKADVKTYLTVNTLLYNRELDTMRQIIDAAKSAGIDAIIGADMAAIQYARQKNVGVQISTQLSISNTESLRFYSQFADRVVLARELTLDQIRRIKDEIIEQDIRGPGGSLVELELFAHGALCVAVSGRCGMSLFCGGKSELRNDSDYKSGKIVDGEEGLEQTDVSANRGKCLQICRRRFTVIDRISGNEMTLDNNYIMSSADLCTVGMLPDLIGAGADVLKIEGRGRPPEYVKTVVGVYREAVDAFYNGNYSQKKVANWNDKLGTVFNRGQSTGMYRGLKFVTWANGSGSQASTRKKLTGVVERYYPKIQVAQVMIRGGYDVSQRDKFLISGDTTGAVMGEIHDMMVDDEVVTQASQGDVITFKVEERVRKGDDFYLIEEVPTGEKQER